MARAQWFGGFLFLLLLTSHLLAQEQPQLRRSIAVNVLDREGTLVTGLTAANFRGEFRGQPIKILSATVDSSPRRIVLLLDASGSMTTEKGKWELAHRAVEDVVLFGRGNDAIALLLFTGKVNERVDFTQGRRAVADSLAAVRAGSGAAHQGSGTALLDAIAEGLILLGSPRTGDVIYAVTDGQDHSSHVKPRRVEMALECTGVRLFLFLFRSSLKDYPFAWILSPAGTVAGPDRIRQFVETTGGNWINLLPVGHGIRGKEGFEATEAELSAVGGAARQLYAQMAEVYRLDVALPMEVDKSRQWKLEVVDEQGKKRKDLKLIYPRRLAPCVAAKP
jgi:hypothetical protein